MQTESNARQRIGKEEKQKAVGQELPANVKEAPACEGDACGDVGFIPQKKDTTLTDMWGW